MANPEIISYVRTERAKGTTDAVIRTNLHGNGWSDSDINDAFAAAARPVGQESSLSSAEKHEISSRRNKKTGLIFGLLCLLDFIIIMLMGGHGLFGVSILSVTLRLLVIYGIASFVTKGANDKMSTFDIITRTVASVIGVLFILIGIFFLYCMFLAGHARI